LVIVTGGLGPTKDDLTRFAIAQYLGVKCRPSPSARSWLVRFLKGKKQSLTASEKIQILLPAGCRPLRNTLGTACGFKFKQSNCRIFAFPGVPTELEKMLEDYLMPVLIRKSCLLEKKVWIWGWPESRQRAALESVEISEPFRFSSLPSEKGTLLTLNLFIPNARKSTVIEGRTRLQSLWKQIVQHIPKEVIIDYDGADLPEVVNKYLHLLSCKAATAESCTGGAVSFLITSIPGSSAVFNQGFITYSNQAKTALLGINPGILKKHGAVSKAVVREMVVGCLKTSGADFACAVSGIAGPEGGSAKKPVGTVWIAAGSAHSIAVKKLNLKGDRNQIRWRSAYAVLNLLHKILKNACEEKKCLHK
jgi:nicotinamide-nucleotide amidase